MNSSLFESLFEIFITKNSLYRSQIWRLMHTLLNQFDFLFLLGNKVATLASIFLSLTNIGVDSLVATLQPCSRVAVF